MKRKVLLFCVVFVATALILTPLCKAFASVTVYGYTDRPYYKPGDPGTLHFLVYNSGTDDLILENLTIYFPWDTTGLWGTNQTVKPPTSTVIASNGGNWSGTVSFAVPNDGRATTGSIEIYVVTDKTTQYSSIQLTVTNVPVYLSLENMNLLTMLLTIIALLTIIGAVIVASAILYATRRRHATMTPGQPHN